MRPTNCRTVFELAGPDRVPAKFAVRRAETARHQGELCQRLHRDLRGGALQMRRLRHEGLEIAGEQASDAVRVRQRLRGQVAGALDERQAARERNADHPGMKSAILPGRRERVGRVGMMGGETSGRHHESILVRLHHAADAELLHDDEAVDRHPRDVGVRAVEAVGGGLHFRHARIRDRAGRVGRAEFAAVLPAQRRAAAPMLRDAHLEPIVEALMRTEFVG